MRVTPADFPMAETTYGIMRRAHFLVALDLWATRPRSAFDMSRPPIDAFNDGSDEDFELAASFYRMTRKATTEERVFVLMLDILCHQRLYQAQWDQQKGNNDPRRVADRSGWVSLKPYERMIHQLEDWLCALRGRAIEEQP